uniref:Glutamine-dependent NAD(+) synthetase n=2 Tax=Octactis speculum TaxID=3111310 RepID=A0A7S2GF13_9STRA
MDFPGNLERIRNSIHDARNHNCKFRTGPELEITGYGCEDSFLEVDTYQHAWDSLAEILSDRACDGILCDIGMPVQHRNVSYNCRVICLNGQIVGIRPKIFLANDGNYREMRYFTPWYIDPSKPGFGDLQDYYLPSSIAEITGQTVVPIGIFIVRSPDTAVSFETCEELFTPNSPHIILSLNGAEIIANGSGSHHQLRKLDQRMDLVRGATSKSGGVYLYANQKGCDGGRLYFDGCAMAWVNGSLVAQGSQFLGLDEVETVVATVNLDEVKSFRSNFISRSFQASSAPTVPSIEIDFYLCDEMAECNGKTTGGSNGIATPLQLSRRIEAPHLHRFEEEIAFGPSGWLWDYLRRSGMRGYFLPLSGGADSSSTAALVAIMCQRVMDELTSGSPRSKVSILADIRRITRRASYTPTDWRDLCGKIFVTCYMASQYSGDETRRRAEELARHIGSIHTSIYIDKITRAIEETFGEIKLHTDKVTSMRTNPKMEGGHWTENIALQNIQARSRMVMSYFLAQLMPWATDGDDTSAIGQLLVLGSANVDEALRGYYTKYDCSAADINPIGGINKGDLKAFLTWAAQHRDMQVLQQVAEAQPSAELTGAEGAQLDEDDMGMSYSELGDLGRARKVKHCGPVSAFLELRETWAGQELTPSKRSSSSSAAATAPPKSQDEKVAQKVKDFYFYNSVNRHKMTTLTPSYHAENYSPDDNRFDLRPFLQNPRFEKQFEKIDQLVDSFSQPLPLSSATARTGKSDL